ncbi:MAG: U32 family peptidase C-terminal domain-containing protein, partial [Parasporobacterium sp.]|nr:U32 family peptidase C-terminal domain-containing protein [Parasporobacterium sp.]
TYRTAIDDYLKDPDYYRSRLDYYRSEISKCTFREYTTGFFFGRPDETAQIYDANTYVKDWVYLGMADAEKVYCPEPGRVYYQLEQKNKFCVGDSVEIMKHTGENLQVRVLDMVNENFEHMDSCPHPRQKFYVDLGTELETLEIIRSNQA